MLFLKNLSILILKIIVLQQTFFMLSNVDNFSFELKKKSTEREQMVNIIWGKHKVCIDYMYTGRVLLFGNFALQNILLNLDTFLFLFKTVFKCD